MSDQKCPVHKDERRYCTPRPGFFEILKDPECKGNIQCFVAAFVLVIGGLCTFLYGIAYLSTTEKVSADIHGAKHLEGRIEKLEILAWEIAARTEKNKADFMLHSHRYSDGKIK